MKKIMLLPILLILVACSKNDDIEEVISVERTRTIIAYMAADNNLFADALADIEEMKQGFSEKNVNLIVFADLLGEAPCLLQIEQGKEIYLKSYPELNSATPVVLAEIIQEVIGLYPAPEYGLILWSHGTSWMPAESKLRSFGKDSGKEMNISDLVESLPAKFDFILFDACLMGAVEVAYELKDKAEYIIASSTETIYEGFPYDKIIPELLETRIDFQTIAQHFFNYYNTMQGAYRSATVTVIDTRELPRLAVETNRIISENEPDTLFERTLVQRLDIYEERYTFDFADFIKKTFPGADKKAFLEQLNRTVLYKNATPMFLSEYEINTYCGLSCYIPHPGRPDLNTYYRTLKWHSDAGISKLNIGRDNTSEKISFETVLPP
jgi:hypothetical protein